MPKKDKAWKYQQECWKNIIGWAQITLGVRFWSRQAEVLQALRNHRLVTVRSGHSIGKSFLSAVATIWYLNANRPSYVITTSSSWKGIEKILWPEIHRRLQLAPLREMAEHGKLLGTEWKLGIQWGAFGVAMNIPENFSGYHTKAGVMVIVDEASALEDDIYDAIMGLMASGNSRVLMIGNPLRPSGPFYNSFKSSLWKRIHISSLESPNVKAGKEVIPGLATARWVKERAEEWGVDSGTYKARVLGEFPEDETDALIKMIWVEAALEREPIPEGPFIAGADIARFGDDETVVIILRGDAIIKMIATKNKDTMQTVGLLVGILKKYDIKRMNVDVIGIGAGVVDRLHELGYTQVFGINVGEKADDTEHFANLRAEAWWRVREWIKEVGCIMKDSKLEADLTTPRVKYTSTFKRAVERKEEIKKRLGRSPDYGDALMLALVPPRHEMGLQIFFGDREQTANTEKESGNEID